MTKLLKQIKTGPQLMEGALVKPLLSISTISEKKTLFMLTVVLPFQKGLKWTRLITL